MRLKLLAVAAMFAATTVSFTPANADTFSWTYSGGPCSFCVPPTTDIGSGTLTTGSLVGASAYDIINITGTWNGFTITGLLPASPDPANFQSNTNVLYLPPNTAFLDLGGVSFLDSGGGEVNIYFDGQSYSAITDLTGSDPTCSVNADCPQSEGTFIVTPLPTALPLFATGLSALGLLGRRRKRKAAA